MNNPNPLRRGLVEDRTSDSCAVVIFGASGDLTRRKELLEQARGKLETFTKNHADLPAAREAFVLAESGQTLAELMGAVIGEQLGEPVSL